MKTGILGLGLTLSAAILASPAGAADHANSSVLGTARASSLSSSTRRAVNEFVDAYANRNSAGLAQATTGDFEVQYGLAQTGTYVTVDEDALIASWRDAGVSSSAGDEHSTVAIFPTADAHVVFVTYRTPGDVGSERIALLELRGHRVARAHDLIAPAPEFVELGGWTKNARTVAVDRDAAQGQ
jgi:acyl-CoA thioesterase FadM